MIPPQELKKAARDQNYSLDIMEKHYVLGWMLYGILSSSIKEKLIFKGGTALSKIHYPGQWRLSEDLDFTVSDEAGFGTMADTLEIEVPPIVKEACGLEIRQQKKPFTNPGLIRTRLSYQGPISSGHVKIEITKEQVIGNVVEKPLFRIFDYPKLSVKVYSLETILSEKFRAILERGYIRDYYDAWRLIKTEEFDKAAVKSLFLEKLKLRNTEFTNVDQLFPDNIVETLESYLENGLTRLSNEPLPTMETMINESKKLFKDFLE